MTPWFALAAQAILAAASLHLVWWHVLPGLARTADARLIVDVWMPVAMAVPLVFVAMTIESDVKGIGWTPLAGPIAVAIASAGFALLAARGEFDALGDDVLRDGSADAPIWPHRARVACASLLAGVVLLMLGAAHTMTIWIGQAAFAVAALLLWVNTPDEPAGSRAVSPTEMKLRAASMAAVFLALGAGAAVFWVDRAHLPLASCVVLAHAIAVAGMSGFAVAPGMASRLGLWTASIGVLATLGVLSLRTLLPRAVEALTADYIEPRPPDIAYGFGAYAFEATALIVLVPAVFAVARLNRAVQRVLGAVLLIATGAIIAWRLLAVSQ